MFHFHFIAAIVAALIGGVFAERAHALTREQERVIIQTARAYRGVPYVWGGTSTRGFDCSGFTRYVYGQAGIQLNRTAQQQYGQMTACSNRPGALLFFAVPDPDRPGVRITHVAIQSSPGYIIHASYSRGRVVEEPIGWLRRYLVVTAVP